MSLHRMLFSINDPQEGANIGSYLRSGASGALITHHSLTQAASGSFVFVDADVTPASDSITESAHGFQNGAKIRLTTTGVLPAGLALATDYFVIRIDADTIKLASSAENAELGIAVDITAAAGGGNHTLAGESTQIRAVDVNIANAVSVSGSVTVSATDLDIRDLVFATDKVDVSGSSNVAVVDGGGSLTVDAVNLDIRDLAFATDSVDVSGSSVSITGTVAVTQSTSPWVVSATNLDIRDLVAATDAVSSWTKDGAGTSITSTLVSGKQGLDVNVVNSIDVDDGLANTAIDASAEAVTTTSAALIASPLASRKYVLIYNSGDKEMFIGESGINAANGFPIPKGAILELRVGAAVAIHAVTATGTATARVLQAS